MRSSSWDAQRRTLDHNENWTRPVRMIKTNTAKNIRIILLRMLGFDVLGSDRRWLVPIFPFSTGHELRGVYKYGYEIHPTPRPRSGAAS